MLERGGEGKLDALTLFVARVRAQHRGFDSELGVGVGLEPDRLGQRLAESYVWIGRWTVVHREHALGPLLDHAQAGIGGDPIAGAKRASTLEAESAPRGASSLAAHPRRRALSRAFGSSARGAGPGKARGGGRTPSRRLRVQLRATGPRRSSLRLPKSDLPGLRAGDDAAPARRSLPRFEYYDCSEFPCPFGRTVDPVDLDVRQPERPPRAALDDPAAQMPTRVEGQVRAGRGSDDLRAPVEQLGVEGARPYLIEGVVPGARPAGEVLGWRSCQRRSRQDSTAIALTIFVTHSRTRRAGGSRAAASPSSRPFGAWSRIG